MKKIQTFTIWLVIYLLVPAGLMMLLYILLPFTARLSLRWLALLGSLLFILELLLWFQYRYFTKPTWDRLVFRKKFSWVLASSVFTLMLFSYAAPNMVQIMEKFPSLAPEKTLELYPILDSTDSIVEIWKVKIGENRIPISKLFLEGTWQKEKNRLWTNDPAAGLIVNGKVPHSITISFWRSVSAGQVQVKWDGKSKILDLQGEERQEAIFRFSFDAEHQKEPDLSKWIRFLMMPGWACLAFLTSGVFYFKF